MVAVVCMDQMDDPLRDLVHVKNGRECVGANGVERVAVLHSVFGESLEISISDSFLENFGALWYDLTCSNLFMLYLFFTLVYLQKVTRLDRSLHS